MADPQFNTLQDDLYDNDQAEVLGRIQTNALSDFTTWDWAEGKITLNFRLLTFYRSLPCDRLASWYAQHFGNHPIRRLLRYDWDRLRRWRRSSLGDFHRQSCSPVKTSILNFINFFSDDSARDLTQNMDVVLDIRHNYDLDLQDISELLNFRIAMIPKSWTDAYGDTIRKNGQEVADCLNQMLNNNAKVRM